MSRRNDDDWQPATSEPGELYTFEGRLRATGHFFRRLKSDEPRALEYRRTIGHTGWYFVAAAVAVPLIAILLSILF